MPLQNRVDPFGAIHAVPERGLFTGNRGIIHDPQTRTLLRRRWSTMAWIICDCDFGNRRRQPMGHNRVTADGVARAGWTELFFLDEVTGLAAGHRPCFFCRREPAHDFLNRFGEAFGIAAPRAPMLDALLHRERKASGGTTVSISKTEIGSLPDGAVVAVGDEAFAVRTGRLWPWRFAGYGLPVAAGTLKSGGIRVLTPSAALAVLRQGYRPVWHDSAC